MTRRVLLQSSLAAVAAESPDSFTREIARRVFLRINQLRAGSGVGELAWSAALAKCATEQSLRKNLLRFPGHDDPERGGVSDRLKAAGIPWLRCGENIFSERGYADPVHFAAVHWWYSPGHRENLLNPEFKQTGVGVAKGSDETFFVTQIFLLRIPADPEVSSAQSPPSRHRGK